MSIPQFYTTFLKTSKSEVKEKIVVLNGSVEGGYSQTLIDDADTDVLKR